MKTNTIIFSFVWNFLFISLSFAQNKNITLCHEKDAQFLLKSKNKIQSLKHEKDLKNSIAQTNTKHSRDWTIVASYQIPGKASGLAWDGTNLYSGIYGTNGDDIYQIDPSDGSYTLLCSGPQEDAYGLTHDGTYLWTTDHAGSSSDPALALQFDDNGTLISSFALPNHYMSGLAYNNGDFWAQTYYPDPGTIYKIDNTGTVLSQFQPPADQPWDICHDGTNLWIADYNANMIYEVDETGTVLSSHASENIKPAGIVYDGQYLWYCDGGLGIDSTLYKIDLQGTGTPIIDVVPNSVDFGFVNIDETGTANFTVYNNGASDLIVNFGDFNGQGSQYLSWNTSQLTLNPGTNQSVSVMFDPTVFTTVDALGEINSNDPLTPTFNLNITGQSVFDNPTIELQNTSYNYGNVRKNALTRWFMTIQNQGNATLTIDHIASDNTAYFIDENINYPLNIGIMQSVELGVWFHPDQAVLFNGTLSIESNDPMSPTSVNLNGTGVEQDYEMGDELWHYNITTGYDPSPKAISSISDINGDGIDDVIVCSEDYKLRCFNGNSHNLADVFWTSSSGNVFNQHGLSIVSDIDGDGIDEIAIGSTGIGTVSLYSGKTGNSIWTYNTNEYGDGGWVYQVDASYDYNNDSKIDVLAVAGDDAYNTGPKRAFCIDGTTGIKIWDRYLGGPGFSVIGVEDFNGDNIPDVVAGASNEDETQGKVIGIDGATGGTEWTKNTIGTSVWALTQIDDNNSDGIKDVVAGDFGGYVYFIDSSNGDTLYTINTGSSLILEATKIEDVNSDGVADVTFSRSNTSAIMLDGTDGSNIWSMPLADKTWNVRRISDITGDNINDIVVGTLYQSNVIYFLDGTNGTIKEQISYPSPIDAMNVIPDIVGDHSDEVVVGGRNGEVKCLSGGLDAYVGIDDLMIETIMGIKAYPNPFNDQIAIAFELTQVADIGIDIYDLTGKKIKSVEMSKFTKGTHKIYWDGKNDTGSLMSPGFYIFELKADGFSIKNKLILSR